MKALICNTLATLRYEVHRDLDCNTINTILLCGLPYRSVWEQLASVLWVYLVVLCTFKMLTHKPSNSKVYNDF